MNPLYHGSYLGGLSVIAANAKSHTTGKNVAYLTDCRAYALICCRLPSENFVTAGTDKNGIVHYFERFPDQLRVLYGGRIGYVYTAAPRDPLAPSKPYAYESETDVPVLSCETIPDVLSALLDEEAKGSLVVHRYDEIDPAEQKEHAEYFRDHLHEPAYDAYRAFLIRHFSPLWEPKE